jgi:soluble lytic murein transglycosylase-like protein
MMLVGGVAVLIIAGVVALATRQPQPVPLAADEAAAVDIPWLPDTVQRWEDTINEMGRRYDIDPNVLAIIMTLESGGYTQAESPAGAQGLMQVTPLTAGDIAERYLKEPRENYDLMDPRTNIEFGTAYLALLRDEFGEQVQGPSWDKTAELIAAGYNGGPGAANSIYKGEGLTSEETLVYSRDAFNMWRERHAEESPTYDRWLQRGGSRLIDLARDEMQ